MSFCSYRENKVTGFIAIRLNQFNKSLGSNASVGVSHSEPLIGDLVDGGEDLIHDQKWKLLMKGVMGEQAPAFIRVGEE